MYETTVVVSVNNFDKRVASKVMPEQSEVEAVLACLVDAVVASVDHNPEEIQDEVASIGGYLWKFPSEGSNCVEVSSNNLPPPAPQIHQYPRKCDQCSICWVSDRKFELDHLEQCSGVVHTNEPHNTVLKAANLGVARRPTAVEIRQKFWQCGQRIL
ncbi:hypothetical protein PHMEG_00011184 [Phytophthora megakarya]|uniref:Uncharacterized protein n=1 Tax=Phytophthora megakarya TaxID=4795 RepID=A0A225WEC5_9STRA|nr:hypothetical protein PHMEG_00011184 [Phytophthora megakarya]